MNTSQQPYLSEGAPREFVCWFDVTLVEDIIVKTVPLQNIQQVMISGTEVAHAEQPSSSSLSMHMQCDLNVSCRANTVVLSIAKGLLLFLLSV